MDALKPTPADLARAYALHRLDRRRVRLARPAARRARARAAGPDALDPLVHLDVGLLHHPAPALDVRLDRRAKLLGRAAFRGHAVGGEQVSHLLSLQHFVGVAVEAVDDR